MNETIKKRSERYINGLIEDYNTTGYEIQLRFKRYSVDLILIDDGKRNAFLMGEQILGRMLQDENYLIRTLDQIAKEYEDYYKDV